jgi:hypothetical protein
MNDSRDDELIRRLDRLGEIRPDAAASNRAIGRVRRTLAARPSAKPRGRILMKLVNLAAALLLAVGAGLLWQLASAKSAFAAVQAAMRAPHSVSCLQSTSRVGEKGSVTVQLLIFDSGLWRADQADGVYTVMDNVNHRILTVNREKKEATLLRGVKTPQINLYQTLRDLPAGASSRTLPREQAAITGSVALEVWKNGQIFTVEANQTTRLPLLITTRGRDSDGTKTVITLSHFAFQELDPKLFSFEPPPEYKLQVLGAADTPDTPKSAPAKDLTVKPRVGVGDVKFGMTREEVEKILGKPDIVEEAPKGGSATLGYYTCGLFVTVGKKSGVGMISCLAQQEIRVRICDFPGKTDKGIALGASSADVIKAYGEPDGKRTNGDSTSLSYSMLDAEFVLVGDRLVQILLNRPRSEK